MNEEEDEVMVVVVVVEARDELREGERRLRGQQQTGVGGEAGEVRDRVVRGRGRERKREGAEERECMCIYVYVHGWVRKRERERENERGRASPEGPGIDPCAISRTCPH